MIRYRKAETAVIILAGGRSSRMGEDKSLLKIEGKPLLEKVLSVAQEVTSEIIVMLAEKQNIPPFVKKFENIKIGRDRVKEQGPLQGISDALPLLSTNAQYIYILTCDLPFLNIEWLEKLQAGLTENMDVVCSNYHGFDNPLLAIYRKKVILQAPKLLKSGIKRPVKLWSGFNKIALLAENSENWVCRDVNTKGEYNEALSRIEKR